MRDVADTLSERDRLDRRLRAGRLTRHQLEQVAHYLANFHAEAPVDPDRGSDVSVLREEVRERIEALRTLAPDAEARSALNSVEASQLGFLIAHVDRFEGRRAGGRVRELHGGLNLHEVWVDDEARVTASGFEEEGVRHGDVCVDLASLSVELALEMRRDLGEWFLAAYADAAHDYDLFPVIDFYESCCAGAAAGDCWSRAADPDTSEAERGHASRRGRRLLRLAQASERRALVPPQVLAMGGFLASGKSTLAARIARVVHAPVVAADRSREFLAGGLDPSDPVWTRSFAPEFADRVYTEVMRRAGAVLESGRPVVIDGCFRSPAMRAAARLLAEEHDVPFHFVECRVGREVIRSRLRARGRGRGTNGSDWLAILDEFAATWVPADEIGGASHLIVDTSRPLEVCAAWLRQRLQDWPAVARD